MNTVRSTVIVKNVIGTIHGGTESGKCLSHILSLKASMIITLNIGNVNVQSNLC